MPAPYGVQPEGFVAKTLEEALLEGQALLKDIFGNSINLNPESRFGQLAAAYAERERRFWEVQQAVHGARDPDNASGTNLDSVCGLTGTKRSPASNSTATIIAGGTAGTLLLAGRVLQVQQAGAKFATLADATIAAVAAWQTAHAYVVGNRVKNGGQLYQVTAIVSGGLSAGSGGPSGTGTAITDNQVTWTWIGTGTGAVEVAVQAQQQGVKVGPARTLTVIVTAVSGWSTALNLLDATVGQELETDPHLRLKREAQLGSQGSAHLEAIRARVLKVGEGTNDPVRECIVFQNTALTTVDGIPGKAVEALVSGGPDAGIRDALFASVAAGIQIYGSEVGSVVDSQGITQPVSFTRPTSVLAYIRVDATVTDQYPADGDDQIAAAIAAWWATVRRAGKNLVPSQISAQVQPVSGVDEVTIKVDDVDPPVSTSALLIALREVGEVDTGRIDVHTSAATP